MQKMPKIKKRHGFNDLAGIGRLAENWPKMQKLTDEATAVHAPLRQGERLLRKWQPAVKATAPSC